MRSKLFFLLPAIIGLNASSANALTPGEYKTAIQCDTNRSIPHCLALLKSPNPKLREDAVHFLGKGGTSDKSVLPYLFQLLSSSTPNMRKMAAFSFGNVIEPEDSYAKPAIPKLVKMLSANTKGERISAIFALARIGNSASTKGVVQYLIPYFNYSDESLRQTSICRLSHMERHADQAAPYLFPLLKDRNPIVKGCAYRTLQALGYKVKI